MSRKNLFTMSRGKFTAFKQRLYDAGLTPELLTRVLKEATPRQMREWVRDCPPRRQPRFVYNATEVLGFRNGWISGDNLPEAEPGEMVIRYGGWSFKELYNNAIVVKEQLLRTNLGATPSWLEESLPAGWYRLRLKIPGNSALEFEERTGDLLPGEKVAPPCLVVAGLLTHYLLTGSWLVRHKVGSAVSDGTVAFERRHGVRWLEVEQYTSMGEMTGYRLINNDY